MAFGNHERSLPQLFTDSLSQIAKLFQTEIRLAKAELAEKAGSAGKALAFVAAGAVLMLAALVILFQALAALLVEAGLSPPLASFLVAVAAAAVGGVLAYAGVSRLKPANLTPDKTLHQLQRDVDVAREQVR
jgi:hypothetical protein